MKGDKFVMDENGDRTLIKGFTAYFERNIYIPRDKEEYDKIAKCWHRLYGYLGQNPEQTEVMDFWQDPDRVVAIQPNPDGPVDARKADDYEEPHETVERQQKANKRGWTKGKPRKVKEPGQEAVVVKDGMRTSADAPLVEDQT